MNKVIYVRHAPDIRHLVRVEDNLICATLQERGKRWKVVPWWWAIQGYHHHFMFVDVNPIEHEMYAPHFIFLPEEKRAEIADKHLTFPRPHGTDEVWKTSNFDLKKRLEDIYAEFVVVNRMRLQGRRSVNKIIKKHLSDGKHPK